MTPQGRGATALAVLVLVGGFVALGLGFVQQKSQTADEAVHLLAGASYLTTRDFSLNPEQPPLVKLLAAAPVQAVYGPGLGDAPATLSIRDQYRWAQRYVYGSGVDPGAMLALARIPNLFLGAMLLLVIARWAHRLWGRDGALVSLALAALEPNLIAHASLVTMDLAVALFSVLMFQLAWEQARSPSLGRLVALGGAAGLALASKFSALFLVSTLAAVVLVTVLRGGDFAPRARPPGAPLADRLRSMTAAGAIAGLVAVGVVFATYGFTGLGGYVAGVTEVLTHQSVGHPAFFLGEHSSEGWLGYFVVALGIKTPLGTIALVVASLAFWKWGRTPTERDVLFLLVPPLLFLAVASFGRLNYGLRHVLVVYPFLLILAGRVATFTFSQGWVRVAVLGVPLAWNAVSVVGNAPHHLAYFNELIGGPANGWRYLSDSNVDWGQDLPGLARFMEAEEVDAIHLAYFGNAPPSAYGVRAQPVPSFGPVSKAPVRRVPLEAPRVLVAISVFTLTGTHLTDPDAYAWLRDREPFARIGHSIHVYDLTGDADAIFELARVYARFGEGDYARHEARRALRADPTHARAQRLLTRLEAQREAASGVTP